MPKSHLVKHTETCFSCSGTGVCPTCRGKKELTMEDWVWANPDAPDTPSSHEVCCGGYSGKINCSRCKAMPKGEDPNKFYIHKCPVWDYLRRE